MRINCAKGIKPKYHLILKYLDFPLRYSSMKGFRDLPTNLICKRDQRFFLHNNFITGRKGRVSTLNIVSVLKKNLALAWISDGSGLGQV